MDLTFGFFFFINYIKKYKRNLFNLFIIFKYIAVVRYAAAPLQNHN